MSTTIDNRVVEMQFDNKHFESNVQTSLGTLDKLKQSLNLEGATKGLENVSAAAKSCDVSGLGGAVESVRAKFSALQVMAVTALANITNSAVNAGKRIVSSFTVDPIKTGFSEYETQINAVQTILANTQSKGSTLDDVNGALDELNTYADKTIYNFTEMTRNIGTFTAAGVDLDKSVSSIKGIANLAAVSGSTSQQASTAMYQLSQALAAGKVQLMDWNSVVNAGMGGQLFQDALKRTATHMGYDVEGMIKEYGSFRESLTQGEWLTADVLTETLTQLSGAYTEAELIAQGYSEKQAKEIYELSQTAVDAATKVKTFTQLMDTLKEAAQSGWTQTWEILVGDFEEAKELWTSVSDIFGGIINASSEARNAMLQGWADGGGREMAIESLKNAFEAIVSIVTPIKEAFREIFPRTTSEQLLKITENIRDFTAKLKLSDSQSAKLKSTFKGLFAVLDIGITFIKEVASGALRLFSNLTGLGGGILSVTGSIGDWLIGLRDSIKENDIFGKSIGTVTDFLQKAIDKIKEFVGFLKNKITMPGFEGFLELMSSLWGIIKKIGSKIAEVGSTIGEALANIFRSGDMKAGLDVINGGILATVLLGIKNFVGNFSDSISDIFDGASGMLGSITGILDSVRGCFEAYQQNLKANVLLKIAGAIAILTAAIVVITMIEPEKLSAALGAITMLFANLVASMAIFNRLGGAYKGTTKASVAMIAMSAAVLILATALKKISSLGWEELVRGFVGIIGLTAVVVASAKALSSNEGRVIKGATSLVIFGAALKILASVCADLSALSWEELAKGLVGVGVLLAELAIFLKVAKFDGKTIRTATGIVILSAAIKILASACADFGSMKWGDIAKGLVAIGALLIELALFTKLTGDAKKVISTGASLVLIGAAMKIFASAVEDFAGMTWEDLAKGLIAIAGSLLAVAVAVKLMPKNMISIGTGLVVVSAALLIIADALGDFGSLSWGEIAKGLVALGGAMLVLAVGLNAMRGTLGGSAAMLIASVALLALIPVFNSLGSLSWTAIAKGLVTLAGAFVVIGVAGAVLGPMTPSILALSASILLLGVACLAVGVGVAAFTVALSTLATIGSAGALAIVAALTIIVSGIAALIPVIVRELGNAILVFCDVIAEGAPAIAKAIKAVVLSLVDVLVECVPAIADGALKLVVGVMEALVEYTPQVVDLLFQFIIGILEGIARNLPALIGAAVDVIMAFFVGVVDALSGVDTNVLMKGIVGVGIVAAVLVALSALAGLVPGAMLGVLGVGAIIAEIAIVLAAVGALAQIPGLDWLINEAADFMQSIGNAIGSLIGGIVGGIMEGISASLPDMATDLSNFMINLQPFIDGAKSIDSAMFEGISSLVDIILILTAANVIDGMTSWLTGGSSLSSFGNDLIPFGEAMRDFSSIISGKIDSGAVRSAVNAGKMLIGMADTIPNSGGVVSWFTGNNDLDDFAEQIVPFGEAMAGFSSVISGNFDSGAVTAATNAGKAMAEMADTIPNSGGVVSWFTGDNDLEGFADGLIPFGEAMRDFSGIVSGSIDSDAVEAAAKAGESMAEMAETLPNSGGVVDFFAGGNDMDDFGEKLVVFGNAMKEFSAAVSGNIDSGAVTAASNAGKAMAEMASTIPNSGGVVSWFTGDNDLDDFSDKIVVFGKAMKDFSAEVSGNINEEAVTAAANAGSVLADLSSKLPTTGGVFSWFTGDTMDLDDFADTIIPFGEAMADFSGKVSGKIDEGAVTAAANAGSALADLSSNLPETGGVVSWFTGDTMDLDDFADKIVPFGEAMAGFSDKVSGNIDEGAITAAANAGGALAELANTLPTEGGVIHWFTGETMSLDDFADKIVPFGEAMADFSGKVSGKIDEDAVTAAANAGSMIADMASKLPTEGGIFTWFTGETMDMDTFSSKIVPFGEAMAGFSTAVSGKIDENAATAAANAGSIIGNMAGTLPTTGSIFAWVTGETMDMDDFSSKLKNFGDAMASFSTAVSGKIDENAATAAANAGNIIGNMAGNLPTTGSIFAWVTGETMDMDDFSSKLSGFGSAMAAYADSVKGIDSDKLTAVTNVATVLGSLATNLPDDGSLWGYIAGNTMSMDDFADELTAFGGAMQTFYNQVCGIEVGQLSGVVDECKALANMAKDMTGVDFGTLSGFSLALTSMANAGIDSFIAAFTNASGTAATAGNNFVAKVIEGIDAAKLSISPAAMKIVVAIEDTFESKYADMKTCGTTLIAQLGTGIAEQMKIVDSGLDTLVSGMVSDVKLKRPDFYSAGQYLVQGFSNGISAETWRAEAKATAMAEAALEAAKEALGEQSPSKEFYQVGAYAGEGFINAFSDYERISYRAGSDMASYATEGLSKAISKVSDAVMFGIDAQPTIRPVLDLSDVTSGADRINGMFAMHPSVGILSNVGAIGYAMNTRSITTNDDVISAIKDLGRNMGNTSGDTYNINGITYDDGSNVQGAVKALVRAARVERRR